MNAAPTPQNNSVPASVSVAARAESLFDQDYGAVLRRTDHIFAGLMVFQWVAAVIAALLISPRAWAGTTSHTHIHVWAAFILGGVIAALPVSLALLRPGRTFTRHVIAVGQMLTSALLIHLMGGRIETHFHVFGSLAFLAFYRDWRVLISATVIVALDHLLRGYFWPQSVYGVVGGAEWRWLEHAGWVAFEDAFLILSCAQGIREMRSIALRQAEIETKNVELAETTRRAEAAAVAKGQFLANMSHEIRTPLNGVIGMTELLANTQLDSKQTKYARLIRSSADALLSLISDILDFSKIEAGKLELAQTDFDPGTLVEETAELLASRAAEKNLEILCRVSPDARRWVRGDPGRLRQVLLNLGANAVKFTDRGEIIIGVRAVPESPGTLRFSVADTGIGIAAESMDRLFKKFSQVDASNSRKYGGTGLGLAISKQLTELMGGRIGIESEPGRGSTFWFEVPLSGAASSAPNKADAGRLEGLRVLIVDDNSTNREILGEQCAGWRFEAQAAEDGLAALRRLAQTEGGQSFDLVILDMQMPGMTGAELGRLLKADPRLASIPLLVLSSIDGFDEHEEDGTLFAARLVKPVRASDLFNAILQIAGSAKNQMLAAPICPSAPRPATTVRRRVLLAEDHTVNQLVAAEILRAAGIDCAIVPDGRQAVEAVRKGGFDLVLMDCQMPEMDGFEATSMIRRVEALGPSGPGNPAHLPIVALTANAVKGDREHCEAMGMDGYVSKPIDPKELLRVIDALTRRGTVAGPRTAIPTEKTSEPIVYEDLLRRCAGNGEIAAAVLDALIVDLAVRATALEKAATEHDAAELGRIAHALKGAAANASAERIRRLAASIEEVARGAERADVGETLRELRAEIDRCTKWVGHNRTTAPTPGGAAGTRSQCES